MAHGGRRPGAGQRPRAGAPTTPLSFRVTEAEQALWEDAAAAEGLSLRDWIRAACDERADTYTRSIVMKAITTDQIKQLRTEAGAAGDSAQVAICDSALGGDEEAIAECVRVIREAQAQD